MTAAAGPPPADRLPGGPVDLEALQLDPQVKQLAAAIVLIDVPSEGAMPPIKFEMPEPTRVAKQMHAKGVRWVDPTRPDPESRVTQIVELLGIYRANKRTPGPTRLSATVAEVLAGWSARDAYARIAGYQSWDEMESATTEQG